MVDGVDAADVAALESVAANQHGVFSVGQAAGLGVDRVRLARAVRSGVLTRVHPSVLRFPAAPLDWRARTWAAVLQAGPQAAASHEAALWLHGCGVGAPFHPAVTLPPGGRAGLAGIRVHRLCDLVDEHRLLMDGVPTTTLARAVVDLTSVLSPGRLEWLVDRLTIIDRRLTVGELSRCLRQVNRRGRRRIRRLQALIDARGPGRPAPRSRVERRVDELLRATSLPEPAREYPLPGWDPGDGFVDRAWPEVRLILEVDGRSWHARESTMAKDRARDRAAAASGWQTVRVLDEEVRDAAPLVVSDLERTYAARLALLHP